MYACGVLFSAIGLGSIGVGAAAAGDGTVGMVLFGLVFLAGAALFFWVGSWGVHDTAPLPDADLRRLGRAADATVIEAAGARVTLRVTPVNEKAFEATAQVSPSGPTPRVGDEVRVRFDPNKRKHLMVMG